MNLGKYIPYADQPTEKPEAGQWRLIAPSGREFAAPSPILCAQLEQKTRVPAHVGLGRIARMLNEPESQGSRRHMLLGSARNAATSSQGEPPMKQRKPDLARLRRMVASMGELEARFHDAYGPAKRGSLRYTRLKDAEALQRVLDRLESRP